MRNSAIVFTILLCAINIISAQISNEYDSLEIDKFINTIPDSLHEGLYEALSDAGGNWKNLAMPVKSLSPEMQADAIWLIKTMDHLDHLLMDSLTFKEHIEMSYHIREIAKYEIADSMFRPFILAYRISYEPVTPWRKKLFDFFWPRVMAYDDPRDVAGIINAWVADSLEEGDYNFFGGMQSPDMTLSRRKGTSGEIAAFTTAALKALGIPSRAVYMQAQGQRPGGKSWVEFYDSEKWIPLYYDEPRHLGNKGFIEMNFPQNASFIFARGGFEIHDVTEEYTEIGYINAEFKIGDYPVADFKDFSIQVVNEGALRAMDYMDTQADSLGIFTGSIGDGEYYITVGVRDMKGNPKVQMIPVSIIPNETTFVEIDVTPPIKAEMAEFEKGKWGDIAFPAKNGKLRNIPLKSDKPTILYIFDYNGEPSIRMLEILEKNRKDLEAVVFGISIDDTPGSDKLKPEFGTIFDINCDLYKTLNYDLCDEFKKQLPMVLYFPMDSNSEFEIITKGYDLNFMTSIKAMIDVQ